jgi:hypothetical protein
MNPFVGKRDPASVKRRYLVHLSCANGESNTNCGYTARIRIWTPRSIRAATYERAFGDECELIEAINPLLPHGSDVRNVFSHIESPEGFFYLLHLRCKEAEQLGWRG